MNRKAKRLKRELGAYKASAIVDIVLAIILWVGIAYLWGMLEAVREDLPWRVIIASLVVVILLGVFLLGNGILTLHLTGRVDEVLKDVCPDEDDE